MSKDLKGKTASELEQTVTAEGRKKHVAGLIFSFIHSKGVETAMRLRMDWSIRAACGQLGASSSVA